MEAAPTTFLIADNQIVQEEFLEDINNILNSGKIICQLRVLTMLRVDVVLVIVTCQVASTLPTNAAQLKHHKFSLVKVEQWTKVE